MLAVIYPFKLFNSYALAAVRIWTPHELDELEARRLPRGRIKSSSGDGPTVRIRN